MTRESTEQLNDPATFTERFINQTNQSVFLTGKAGTGKTTLLKKIIASTHKNAIIVAPTGIAALNAGGVTIHSFFQLPFAGFIPEFGVTPEFSSVVKLETKDTLMRHFGMNKQRQAMIRNLELLIIDEVSMLRADLLDAIDWTLRNVRKIQTPFGGVQILYIGDLMQLPPVVKQEEWTVLRKYYAGMFFFNARVIQEQMPLYIELSTIYRQKDEQFIELLNNLRENKTTKSDVEILNRYVNPDFDALKENGYITLTTHNFKADKINSKALSEINSTSYVYSAEIIGDFPQHLYPVDQELELKVGAQVMFIKNDPSFEKSFFNGKMGRIEELNKEEITVVFPDENRKIRVEKYEWENIRYVSDEKTGEIKEEVVGTFVHYPLRLAWAITIHKSQGLTFEKAVLDVSAVFAPGQAYVALSRLKSLSGLVLQNPLKLNGLTNDQSVLAFATTKADEKKLTPHLEHATLKYLLEKLTESFDWYDLHSKWMVHEAGYKHVGSKSEKGKNKVWITHQTQAIQASIEPSKKFRNQLVSIFSHEKIDLTFAQERVRAAYDYFFKILDDVLTSNLKKILELSKSRKTKQYAEELEELDEILTTTILKLKKARILIEAFVSGKELSKEIVWNTEINNYKIGKIAALKQEARQSPTLLDEDETETYIPVRVVKKQITPKKEKKNTYELTLNLLQEGLTIEEIAQKRQLSLSTINGHFATLIKAEKIEIHDVLANDRILILQDLFFEYEGSSLGSLKEKSGDKVTWDELKLYQASLMR
jgi:uncharacterized protein YpbB